MHPNIPHSKALMLTLVPKFILPPGPKPEIVFVVDRSGSMSTRIGPLKSSLGVFLKSLPLGVLFNICSFGSSHSFLWPQSQPYSAESLEQAQRHVAGMQANYGGTEILPPIQSAVSMRYKDVPLEIMVLTDGEVWRPDELYRYIEQATADGDVRLFTLGIGQDVSHALVEGMARVGRGFAQIVSNEKEGMEGKVVRMLRGGLSAHVKDYRLDWEGKPSEEEIISQSRSSAVHTTVPGTKKISLFDTKANTESPISFTPLPEFVVPGVLQAPYKIPPLFPFSRSTAYVILSSRVPAPSSVWLRGTTPSGDELELEIKVQTVKDDGETIHQLAGRKILQELEEGTGYLHSGKYGVDREVNSGTFEEWVKREGVRVGIKYGLASKWTSFLAVTKREEDGKQSATVVDSGAEEDNETEYEFVPSTPSSDTYSTVSSTSTSGFTFASTVARPQQQMQQSFNVQTGFSASASKKKGKKTGVSLSYTPANSTGAPLQTAGMKRPKKQIASKSSGVMWQMAPPPPVYAQESCPAPTPPPSASSAAFPAQRPRPPFISTLSQHPLPPQPPGGFMGGGTVGFGGVEASKMVEQQQMVKHAVLSSLQDTVIPLVSQLFLIRLGPKAMRIFRAIVFHTILNTMLTVSIPHITAR
jgi:hypothetical protein